MKRYRVLQEKAVTEQLPSDFKKKVNTAMKGRMFADEDTTMPDFVKTFNDQFKSDNIKMITLQMAKRDHKINTAKLKSWEPDVGLMFGFYDPKEKIIYVVEDAVELFLDYGNDWYYPGVEKDVLNVLEEIIEHELVHKAQFEALPKDLKLEVEEGANITSKPLVDYFGGRDETMAYAKSAVKKASQRFTKEEILKYLSSSFNPDSEDWKKEAFYNNNFLHIYRILFDPGYATDISAYTTMTKQQVVSKYKDTWKLFLRYMYEFANKL
jgi:hypothetical protein